LVRCLCLINRALPCSKVLCPYGADHDSGSNQGLEAIGLKYVGLGSSIIIFVKSFIIMSYKMYYHLRP
jgi:hypothetical protein